MAGFDPYPLRSGLDNYEGVDGTSGGYSVDRWSSNNDFDELQPQTDDSGGPWHADNASDNWLVFNDAFGDGGIVTQFWQSDDDGLGLVIRHSAVDTYYHLVATMDSMPRTNDGSRGSYTGWRLYKHQGSVSVLDSVSCADGQVPCPPNTEDQGNVYHVLRLEMEGRSLRAMYEDPSSGQVTILMEVDDPSPLPAGRFGLWSYNSGSGIGESGFFGVRAYQFDSDQDGFVNDVDCAPADRERYPGALEICEDDIDQDCDGVDQPCPEGDRDGDGYAPPEDCNDDDPSIFPRAYELCDDGIDNDCDDLIDENCYSGDRNLPSPADLLPGQCACGVSQSNGLRVLPLLLLITLPALVRRRAG